MVRRQNEGSFGCEAVARALRQPIVPDCAEGFLFLFFMQLKFFYDLVVIFCRFTMPPTCCITVVKLLFCYAKFSKISI